MSILDKKYVLKVDTKSTFFNPTPQFSISDNETSDFNIRVTNANKIINLSDVIAVMVVINPNNEMYSDFVEVEKAEEGLLYCNLSQSLKNIDGTWKARLMCIYGEERIVTSAFSYKVNTDEFVQLNQEVVTDDRFGTLTQMLSRLSSIELQETIRQEGENSRIEAERQREIAKQQLIADVKKLIADTNLKVETNLSEQNKKVDSSLLENSTQVTKLISDTETKMDNYKSEKDAAINLDLQQYKEATTRDIDNYKLEKDVEIDKDLTNYKTSITKEIDDYKNLKNTEINNYKVEKDLEIDTYIETKNLELDKYVAAKNDDIDNYKNSKDTLINNKLEEVDTAEQSRVEAEQQRVTDHTERETFLNSFESQLGQIVSKNGEQDGRLNSIEYVNKRQDVMLNGLFNENADGRLSITSEGNNVKLEHSKDGIIEVEKVVGNTLVNIMPNINTISPNLNDGTDLGYYSIVFDRLINSKTYNLVILNNPCITQYYISSLGISWTNVGNSFIVNNSNLNQSEKRNLQFKTTRVLTNEELSNLKFILVEGNTSPTQAIEGMQSTFEDKLVTQEMVDAGEELAENLGKYKVELKTRGKNLLKMTEADTLYFHATGAKTSNTLCNAYTVECESKTTYMISANKAIAELTTYDDAHITYWKDNQYISGTVFIPSTASGKMSLITPVGCNKMIACIKKTIENITMVEEGTVATPYEPYKEYKTSILLDEPLYKGDEICIQDGKLGVLHNSTDEIDYNNLKYSTTYEGFKFYECLLPKLSTNLVTSKINIISDNFKCKSYDDRFNNMSELECYVTNTKRMFIISNKELNELKELVKNSKFIYPLEEPIFVPILENTPKWILDCFNSCTVQFETNVPILSSSFKYTGNVPSVYGLEETGITNTNDIAVTQTAVDFLLMSNMGKVMMISFKNNTKGGNNMGAYFASRIMKKALKYEDVIRKYPEFKEDIDFILRSEGYGDLIVLV